MVSIRRLNDVQTSAHHKRDSGNVFKIQACSKRENKRQKNIKASYCVFQCAYLLRSKIIFERFVNCDVNLICYTFYLLYLMRDETLADCVKKFLCIYRWDIHHIQRRVPNNTRNSKSVSQTVYFKHVLLFRAYLIRNHLLIKLVDFFSPWNHQKTMITGEMEVKIICENCKVKV